jgi:hypothetical protein
MSLRAATANGFTFAAILKGTAAKSYNNKINTTNSDIPLWYAPICGVTFFSPIKIIKGKNPWFFGDREGIIKTCYETRTLSHSRQDYDWIDTRLDYGLPTWKSRLEDKC